MYYIYIRICMAEESSAQQNFIEMIYNAISCAILGLMQGGGGGARPQMERKFISRHIHQTMNYYR